MARQKRNSTVAQAATKNATKGPLPVTVLSGFLGGGKTTLLRHILQSPDHGLRIAVIVNDMASVNIDGNLIARSNKNSKTSAGTLSANEKVVKEKIVQMQNGCICCTLRSDLLTELARLAWSEEGFDHVVIESSGISEPQQVAETFTAELTEAMIDAEGMETEEQETFQAVAKLGGLKTIATVDTMVTVVDAFRFFSEFDTAEFLQDRFSKDEVPDEDERTISDLFADQIEFANVLIINKVDMVDQQTLGRVRAYIKALNPTAKVVESKYSKVNVREILNTGQFNFAEAITSPGWLRSLHEMTVMDVQGKNRVAPKPETLEYGIGSFVYRARRPFDPLKLYNALYGKFVLIQGEHDDDDESAEGSSDEQDDEDDSQSTISASSHSGASAKEMETDQILANKKACLYFSGLYRSKGVFWLATRPSQMGSWSTAGAMLTLGSEMPWFCTVPEDEWNADEDLVKNIKADYTDEWGDRRQEIVMIGEGLDEKGITEFLDRCLLNRAEMRSWERIMRKKIGEEEREDMLREKWDDGFYAKWVTESMDEHDHKHDHHGHGHKH